MATPMISMYIGLVASGIALCLTLSVTACVMVSRLRSIDATATAIARLIYNDRQRLARIRKLRKISHDSYRAVGASLVKQNNFEEPRYEPRTHGY